MESIYFDNEETHDTKLNVSFYTELGVVAFRSRDEFGIAESVIRLDQVAELRDKLSEFIVQVTGENE